MRKGKFIVISGPSGVGKGTICSVLLNELEAWYSVSMTTREKREGETHGKEYYFVTKEEFEEKINNNELLEYNNYNGNYYGTPKDAVVKKLNEGIDVFTEIDVNGAKQIKSIFPESLLIYIAPPSIEELRKRLTDRATETDKVIEERIKIAEEELKQANIYDFIVVNENLERAIEEVRNIITKEDR